MLINLRHEIRKMGATKNPFYLPGWIGVLVKEEILSDPCVDVRKRDLVIVGAHCKTNDSGVGERRLRIGIRSIFLGIFREI